ncbi:MAG: pyridoxine 5'-phosphate synthase [Bacteroidota bacterium]|nr:pyridoxine 5'-phosphate synthase [Bacteroidota bacterium]
MVKLSVNINKIATIRNARGGNMPDVLTAAMNCERFGADGITVHPRPDERHITYKDVLNLRPLITTEFNIEGNPISSFIDLVLSVKPHQVTLVPDAHDAITSNAGWNTIKYKDFLKDVISAFKECGIRTSIFIDPDKILIDHAFEIGTDRIELYTEPYAKNYSKNRDDAINLFAEAADHASKLGLGINAGHDLNLENLKYFKQNINGLLEVSIGHALICDALYLGLENTIQMYKRELK